MKIRPNIENFPLPFCKGKRNDFEVKKKMLPPPLKEHLNFLSQNNLVTVPLAFQIPLQQVSKNLSFISPAKKLLILNKKQQAEFLFDTKNSSLCYLMKRVHHPCEILTIF